MSESKMVTITEAQGWLESLYAKWNLIDGANSYNVYIKGGQYDDWTQIDQQLVRNYGTYGRADVVGLMAGTYALKVAAVDENGQEMASVAPATVSNLEVKNYSRQGFAFMGGYSPGAYNADGTLKQGAKVFYVTKKTAKTISTTVVTDSKGNTTECTGLQAIIAAYEKGQDKTPIAFRFIGLVEIGDLDAVGSKEEGIQVKGRKADSELNLTFEGIGDDATTRGFGFLARNAKSVEFRNIGIMRCLDDGISLDTDNSNIWVHHCDFFYGPNGGGDHAKGDGACDVKSDSKLITVSYNRFWDTGKSNMFGMKSESGPNYISYDHNWFDHSDSRHPRVRTMSVHVWNNYFDNVAKYGVGATSGASVFVENNYFLKTKKPILASLQGTDALGSGTFSGENGGMIKAYGNYFDRSATNFKYYTQKNPSEKGYDAYETDTRDEQVPATEVTLVGGTTYNNFDTNASVMYEYDVLSAADVPATVTGYYGAGRLNHGDFRYTFKDNVGLDTDDSAYDTVLGGMLDSYKSSLVGFFGEETSVDPIDPVDPVDPVDPEVPEGTILVSFDGSPSNSMFTAANNYGDGKITYEGVYYKKGQKMDSKGNITFTPTNNYNMTLVLATAKSGRNVSINGNVTTVSGTENTEGKYYELQPIAITAGTQYVLTKGTAESIVMLIKLEPATE
jgi:pectate lyase